MLHMSNDVGVLTERYMLAHGIRARAYLGDDISRAIGKNEWEKVHLLEMAKVRLQRLELLKFKKTFGRRRWIAA